MDNRDNLNQSSNMNNGNTTSGNQQNQTNQVRRRNWNSIDLSGDGNQQPISPNMQNNENSYYNQVNNGIDNNYVSQGINNNEQTNPEFNQGDVNSYNQNTYNNQQQVNGYNQNLYNNQQQNNEYNQTAYSNQQQVNGYNQNPYNNQQQNIGYNQNYYANQQQNNGYNQPGYQTNPGVGNGMPVVFPTGNQQQQQSNQKQPKQKRVRRRRGGFFRFFIGLVKFAVILVIIVGIVVGFVSWRRNKAFKDDLKAYEDCLYVNDIDYLYEEMKKVPSDIDGMTCYDKYEMGLYPGVHSDSDHDGVMDKDEIEVYHTDPTKVSSSGDAIPDGYKIKNGLDVTKKYSNDEVPDDLFYHLEEITIKTNDADNAYCYMYEHPFVVDGITALKSYRIDGYVGDVEIDFSRYVDAGHKYVVFKQYNGVYDEPEEVKLKDGKVSFKVEKDGVKVGLFIKDKVEFNSIFQQSSLGDGESETNNLVIRGNDAIILYSPLFSMNSSGTRLVFVWEANSLFGKASDELNEQRAEEIKKYLTSSGMLNSTIENELDYSWNNTTVKHFYSNPLQLKMIDFIFQGLFSGKYIKSDINEEEQSRIKEVMSKLFVYRKVSSSEWPSFIAEMSQQPSELEDDDSNEEEYVDIPRVKPSEYMSSFDISRDAFPFPNISSYISPGGNCAGFAYITTNVFNRGCIPNISGEILDEDSGKTYVYDIADTSYVEDLLVRGRMNRVKSIEYFRENYNSLMSKEDMLNQTGIEEDLDLVDYIGAMWFYENHNIGTNGLRSWDNGYRWSEIENLMRYLESGDKIVSVGMVSSGTGHAVNGIGMTQDPDDPFVYYLWVYDNNFPNNLAPSITDGKNEKQVTCKNYIKITRKVKNIGIIPTSSYDWEYYPVKEYSGYHFSNQLSMGHWEDTALNILGNALQLTQLVFSDEDCNIIK